MKCNKCIFEKKKIFFARIDVRNLNVLIVLFDKVDDGTLKENSFFADDGDDADADANDCVKICVLSWKPSIHA